jgi:phosphoserine phosphatase
VRSLARERGYDLSRCAAYSDSANDIPMLSLVGSPCAVNPDGALRAHARAQGWTVRDFRGGRRAAKVGVQAAGVTALAGVLAAAASRRRSR